jgi:hypothetical protein
VKLNAFEECCGGLLGFAGFLVRLRPAAHDYGYTLNFLFNLASLLSILSTTNSKLEMFPGLFYKTCWYLKYKGYEHCCCGIEP